MATATLNPGSGMSEKLKLMDAKLKGDYDPIREKIIDSDLFKIST